MGGSRGTGSAIPGREGRLAYQMRLPQFEGPFDLLLELIDRRELEVTAISLAAVADQFLAQIATLPTADSATLAEFVAIGARLVLIKSRALLPRPPRPDDEEDPIDDAEALAEQLRAYRLARAAAVALAERYEQGIRSFPGPVRPHPAPPAELAPATIADLVKVMRRRLLTLPAEPTEARLTPMPSLADKIAQIEGALGRDGRTSLVHLLNLAASRPEVIVTFIALLELVRRRRIVVSQPTLFGDIDVLPHEASA